MDPSWAIALLVSGLILLIVGISKLVNSTGYMNVKIPLGWALLTVIGICLSSVGYIAVAHPLR